MADVYLAAVAGGKPPLQVIKRLHRERARDAAHITMFLDEARLLARFDHPNVVRAFELGAAGGEYFIAMEWLEGAPLSRVLHRARNKPPPEGLLLRVLADALAGLQYAHALRDDAGAPLGIVHRDASAHNIFVTFDGQTKVVDFGIAKASARMTETQNGVMKGKVGYMAPEQVRCLPLDKRADVFVIGIVLWEILAGRKMWEGAAGMEILRRLAEGDLPRIEDARPDVPPALARICARALASEPSDRYATAAEMRGELLRYMDEAALVVTTEDVGRYVADLFADKRAEMRATIEHQLGKLETGTLPRVSAAESEVASLPRIEPVTGPRAPLPQEEPRAPRVQSEAPAARWRSPILAAVLLLLLAAVGAFVLLYTWRALHARAVGASSAQTAEMLAEAAGSDDNPAHRAG